MYGFDFNTLFQALIMMLRWCYGKLYMKLQQVPKIMVKAKLFNTLSQCVFQHYAIK